MGGGTPRGLPLISRFSRQNLCRPHLPVSLPLQGGTLILVTLQRRAMRCLFRSVFSPVDSTSWVMALLGANYTTVIREASIGKRAGGIDIRDA